MKIECFISLGCGSEPELRENVMRAVAEAAPGAEVLFLRITDEEAARLGLRGSPSVLIDGVDIAPVEMEGFG
jgi:hypothetical protein